MTSLFPPGAGGGDTKGPVREPLHRDERDGSRYGPRPPSESERQPEERRGVGVFRYAGCGWGFTIALFLMVGVLIGLGYLRDDPGRNPAPATYRTAVCAAFEELSAGTRALARGVAAEGDSARRAAGAEVEGHVAGGNAALTDLPDWQPGRSLDELLGAQIITLTNGADALPDDGADADLEIALEVDATLQEQLADGRYGFDCSG